MLLSRRAQRQLDEELHGALERDPSEVAAEEAPLYREAAQQGLELAALEAVQLHERQAVGRHQLLQIL